MGFPLAPHTPGGLVTSRGRQRHKTRGPKDAARTTQPLRQPLGCTGWPARSCPVALALPRELTPSRLADVWQRGEALRFRGPGKSSCQNPLNRLGRP